jgi:hypothetical protein
VGHSRPARAGTKPGHVRYAPIAIKFRSEAKCRDGPEGDVHVVRNHARVHDFYLSCAMRRIGWSL